MAKNIIAQAFDNVNPEIPVISSVLSCGETGYLVGMSNMDCNLNDYRVSGTLRGEMVRQIMARPNELALAVLSSVGSIGFVPGIGENSIPLNEFADFYGVSEKYLTNLMSRREFHDLYPGEVSSMYLSDILKAKVPISLCCNSQQKSASLQTFHIDGSHGRLRVSLPKSRKFNLYSPRLVLITALMMVYTDKSAVEGNIKKTLLALKRGPYRFVRKEGEKVSKNDDMVHISANGDITLSPEVLTSSVIAAVSEGLSEVMAKSVKQAMKEAVSDLMTEFCAAVQKKETAPECAATNKSGKFPDKLKKPDNWESVLQALNKGELTVKKAASLVGMSVSSFRNYAKGLKTFD